MRLPSAPEMLTPILPSTVSGQPLPSTFFQELPPSADRYRPLPVPPLVRLHGVRFASQSAANRMLGFLGSMARSIAPVLSSLKRTFSQLFPPSRERKTPRSAFGP